MTAAFDVPVNFVTI